MCKNEFDDMFFFHHEYKSSYAMFSLSSKFQNILLCSFLSRERFIPILAHFVKISPKNMGPSLCKNLFDDIFFFHHELSSYAMLRLSSNIQKISPCSFLSRGRFIPILAHFLKISLKNMEAFIVQERIWWHILFSSWPISLCNAKAILKISKDFIL